MDQLRQELPGVAAYLDDILISPNSAEEHLQNLRRLLQQFQDNRLCCRLEKCSFAQPYVQYLGHYLSMDDVAKASKSVAITKMPAPTSVSSLRSFLDPKTIQLDPAGGLAFIFGLNKLHQFLYGQKFQLVTDHKPLIALFGPTKPIPAQAVNRLARSALTLSQYDYTIEYR
ncbi:hypothetical protein RRG08_005191 [Elysia crispata]|uniref:Reverse transcriptase RNase H-like domain-containing protein n=1 Tax=Elysia crispata TaxID=231223 RepID=A0AAE1DGT6_9GAST|nr:hypothetical protein RRG08_005191 [Elysia crispata]